MTNQEAKQRLERIWKAYTSAYDTASIEDLMAFDMATNALGAIEQIQWERDMAIKQLHDLGYGLGEKPRDDLISRQVAIDALERIFDRCEEIEAHLPEGDPDRVGYKMYPDWLTVWKYLHQVPSAQPELSQVARDIATIIENEHDMRVMLSQPEVIRCKDCVHHIDGFFCGQANHHTSDKDHCASVFGAERRTDEQTVSE